MDHKIPLYFSNGTPRWQTITTTTTPLQSTVINARKILVVLTGDHHWIQFGSNPSANTASFAMPDSETFLFEFTPGWKVSARTHSNEGTVTIVNMDPDF